jgi:hypothetical protein
MAMSVSGFGIIMAHTTQKNRIILSDRHLAFASLSGRRMERFCKKYTFCLSCCYAPDKEVLISESGCTQCDCRSGSVAASGMQTAEHTGSKKVVIA